MGKMLCTLKYQEYRIKKLPADGPIRKAFRSRKRHACTLFYATENQIIFKTAIKTIYQP
jgi:hypothetical protein